MNILWVVEVCYRNGTWKPATDKSELPITSTKIKTANIRKQLLQNILCHNNDVWWSNPEHFRVKKYISRERHE